MGTPYNRRRDECAGSLQIHFNDLFYLFGLHSSREAAFIIHWANPIGMGYATETIYTALHDVQPKVFDKFSL